MIAASLTKIGRKASRDAWAVRHVAAWTRPSHAEAPIVRIVEALAEYADRHAARYGSDISDDGVLGAGWRSIGDGVIKLLNGETGGLDCGTVDALIRDMGAFTE